MRAVKSSDTSLERKMDTALRAMGLNYLRNDATLPGKPDFVFHEQRLILFVDGDFWHGWHFSSWSHKLPPYWQQKIDRTRRRDAKNHRRLRRAGWRVLRIWGHQIEGDFDLVLRRLKDIVRQRRRMGAERRCQRIGK
jgi:DNA mismatch endonuclease (patch repair protein)